MKKNQISLKGRWRIQSIHEKYATLAARIFFKAGRSWSFGLYFSSPLVESIQSGIQEIHTANAAHFTPREVWMRIRVRGTLMMSIIRSICARSRIFPIPANTWKAI